jgi:hypothetical protein
LLALGLSLAGCGDDTATPGDGGPSADAGARDAGDMARVDSGPAPVMPADAGSCGEFGASEVCAACLGRECCAQGRACLADEACPALVGCARDCGADDAGDCRSACVDAHGTGRAPYNDLVLCMGQRCRAECPFTTP